MSVSITLLLLITYFYFPYKFRTLTFPVYREIIKYKLISELKDFKCMEGHNYKIYYLNASPRSLKAVEDSAEIAIEEASKIYGFVPDDNIDIIIYPKMNEIASKAGLAMGNEAVGIYYAGTISILDPEAGKEGGEEAVEYFINHGPLLHELIHYVMDYKTRGNIPAWFSEGLALYGEYIFNGQEWGKNKNYEDYFTLEEMMDEFYSLDEAKAYKQSFLAVKNIGDNFGMSGINQITLELRNGRSLVKACTTVLHMGINEIFEKSQALYG